MFIIFSISFRYSFNTPHMKSKQLCLLLLLSAFSSSHLFSQNQSPDSSQWAPVNVFVTDFKNNIQANEQIIFTAQKRGKQYSGISGRDGRFSIKLPAGDTFIIRIKTIFDSTKYGVISIPALEEGQYFPDPFVVKVKFELAKTYTLDEVYFDFGKSTLRPESFKELNELYDYLKQKESIKVEIAGHTDNIGKDADNLKLSQSRAEAIRQYLIKKGINASRIIAKGYGATQPVTTNDTDEGRQKNRRTEVRIL